ncbi:ubiquinone biosynthesis hydroxylase [Rhizobium ruizarguesonis]|jgi:2-octaprenyl-6-methoxyphenol hydroxylase|uniref:Ubiquinone biosynthesis hydroxylase n=1 Tax=Rhizobium ruizarguesonis TaxID=2081791 RepID=A0AAE8QGI8_9HYPH|nr:ubiquinone biosynthesis hydroxylase [Rhizobium ruizarguesonis]MBY5895734.1 ubiquinone biosynthesis hydroxylase [Rhizobium leguminosarum]TBY70488.1 ubiquinone biosynthesis hydroxylase [Rhizobium leguminosarum bv. viciae]TAU07590.1 ubiquinone biosynthesis hydroxylase [Rhizobium ruizarguesonis]TAW58925.1 ubiquinone biosynthesis hydroxylase [Rhizobium ruizarguesonis]TAY81450.1 ubiquinone biosynthesis hydroxylase [Rhizobium ruizarguesonis]
MLDMLVVGGGYVGLSAAVAVKQAAPHLNVAVVEAAPENVWKNDTRASAIIAAAAKMLEAFGIWNEIEPEAQPITKMIVTDSKTSDPVRPVFLTFDGEVADGRPFAHMIPNVAMVAALRGACERLGIDIRHGLGATELKTHDTHVTVTLSDGGTLETKLLVACDGVRSKLRDLAGIRTVTWDYGQSGIVATVEHERPHDGCAEEHFLPAGPFAILPLKNNRSSLVWTERTPDANRLVAADDLIFEEELERRFGHKLGALKVIGDKRAFPLGLTLARSFIAPRFALAGDAAHGIHPISGQGLNLGFKDVAALAETIVDADRLGLDIGSINILERYQTWRRFDTFRMGVTTDVLNRLFSNDATPIRIARDVGLGIVDRLPRLKSFFIGQAAGTTAKDNPRLLAGETI